MTDGEYPRPRALLSAALLAHDGPLTKRQLAGLLGGSENTVEREIEALRQTLQEADLGIRVDAVAAGYRLVVDPQLVPALASLLQPAPLPALSQAALETLALVAYHQPVTRGELEAARGASCTSTLDTLQERRLIKVVGHRDVIGRPLLYATTEKFLVEFGLRTLADLPPIDQQQPTAFLRS